MTRGEKLLKAVALRDKSRDGKTPPLRKAQIRRRLPCLHEGAVLEFCPSCTGAGAELKHVRDCDVHEKCTRGLNQVGMASCASCISYDNGMPKPVIIRPPMDALAPGEGGFRFNPGLIDFKGRRLMAYRTGWYGSNIGISEVFPSGEFGEYKIPNLIFPYRADYGREDPRLFIHNDKLHVAYIGVSGKVGPTHQMYARLTDDLEPEAVFYPHYEQRRDWEKNWQFFSYKGELLAVYDIHPHTIVRIDRGQATKVYETNWKPDWAGGMLRGSTPPVLVGDEYWSFFHGRREPSRQYCYGLYTFETKPPFRPLRYTPDPLHWADRKSKPKGQYAAVTYPCGAILKDGRWMLSAGLHDRWIEFHYYAHKALDNVLVNVEFT